MLQAIEYQMDESIPDGGDMKLRPTEYFSAPVLRLVLVRERRREGGPKEIGEDNVLFETDFPHPTCLYPNVREHVEKSLAGLSEKAQRKVLYENAARVYQLPTPA